jgi:hypothetical protein
MSVAQNKEFLIRVDGDFFVQEVSASPRGLEVHGTRIISAALHFDFSAAERQCQQLRRRGYPYCVTTTIDGRPVTAGVLRGEDSSAKDDLPRNEKELDAMPASEFRRRMKNDAPFVGRVHEIWKLKAEGQK